MLYIYQIIEFLSNFQVLRILLSCWYTVNGFEKRYILRTASTYRMYDVSIGKMKVTVKSFDLWRHYLWIFIFQQNILGGRNFIKLLGYVMYKDCVWLFVLGISTVEGTHTIHENYSPSLPLTWILIILTKSSLACVCSRSRASTFSLALVCCSC